MKKRNNASNRLIFSLFGILLTVTLLSSCSKDTTSLTDSRDGQVYQIVTIGTQTWMAQNLKYEIGNNWCYNNDSANCATYGRLYDWQTAKGACPSGWHLPTDEEWFTLTNFLGGSSVAGGKLKSVIGWNASNTGSTNQSGFSALPGGIRVSSGGFDLIGFEGSWWSATEIRPEEAWRRELNHVNDSLKRYETNKEAGLAIRCLKD